MFGASQSRINPGKQIANAQGLCVAGDKTSAHLSHHPALARLGRNNGHAFSIEGERAPFFEPFIFF
jgi:hypothetical protein